jgi:hypothetical protein
VHGRARADRLVVLLTFVAPGDEGCRADEDQLSE